MPKIILAAARVNAGYSQEGLAKEMGVSRQAVIKWEGGKSRMRKAHFYMFCRLTGFSEDDIYQPLEAECQIEEMKVGAADD